MNRCLEEHIKNVYTKRLVMIPINLKAAECFLAEDYSMLERLRLKRSSKWPRNDTKDALTFMASDLKKHWYSTGFEIWVIVLKSTRTIIGDIGFKGAPNSLGEVEIGYGVVDEERKKGFCYEACNAMINWAFTRAEVNVVRAECDVTNEGSIKILNKVNMIEIDRNENYIFFQISREQWKNNSTNI